MEERGSKPKGRPRVHHGDRINSTIRFPEELYDAIRAIADERMVSLNYVVLRACEFYLANLPPPPTP